jgi:hypothetical protein
MTIFKSYYQEIAMPGQDPGAVRDGVAQDFADIYAYLLTQEAAVLTQPPDSAFTSS